MPSGIIPAEYLFVIIFIHFAHTKLCTISPLIDDGLYK